VSDKNFVAQTELFCIT